MAIVKTNINGNDDVLASDEAKTIAYDDESTQLNANTVQIALEKIKALIDALPIVVENVEVTGSVNGSSTATIAGDVTKEGYIVLGILGYEIAGSSQCYCYRVYTVGNSARFYTRNNGSGTVNLTITAHILYQVDNGSPRIIEPPITNEGVE